jgi:hypothetical protein
MLYALALIVALLAAGTLVVAAALALRRPLPPGTRTKRPWQSKQLIFNVAAVFGAGIAIVEASLGEIEAMVPPWAYLLLAAFVAMVNVALRLVTTKAVTLTPTDRT